MLYGVFSILLSFFFAFNVSRVKTLTKPQNRIRWWWASYIRYVMFLLYTYMSDCVAAGRAAAEGVRPGLRHLPVHCHQHLRDHRLEGLLPSHSQHWLRYLPTWLFCFFSFFVYFEFFSKKNKRSRAVRARNFLIDTVPGTVPVIHFFAELSCNNLVGDTYRTF